VKHIWLPLFIGVVVLTQSRAAAQDAPADDASTDASPSDEGGAIDAPGAAGEGASAATDTAPNAGTGEATAPGEASEAADAESESDDAPAVVFHGAIEAAYGYNFNAPSNRVTA